MIPYDDSVVALATWRARQGLPVAQILRALTPPPPAPKAAAPRTAPPNAPPGRPTPPPMAAVEPDLEVDDALLEEAHYQNEGDDFALAFSNLTSEPAESTAIGVPPPGRPSEETMLDDMPPTGKPKGRGGRSDW